MKLYDVLRTVVEQFGEEILAQPKLKGFVQDYMPDDRQSIHMIQSAVTSQLGQQLLDLKNVDKSTRELRMASIRQAFQDRFFLRDGVAEYLVDCFQYALGWKKDKPSDPSEEKREEPKSAQEVKKQKPVTPPRQQPTGPQKPANPPKPPKPPKPPRNTKKVMAIAAVVLGVVAFFFLGGWQWLSGLFAPSAERMYVLSETVVVRANASDTATVVKEAVYGQELMVMMPDTGRWAQVQRSDETTEGYVLKESLVDKKDLERLNSLWGDDEARQNITESRYRRALIHFRKEVNADNDYKVYGADYKGRNYRAEEAGEFGAFAFIADNKGSGLRQAAVYSFDAEGHPLLEKPVDEQPSEGQYIKKIALENGNYELVLGGKKVQKASPVVASSESSTPKKNNKSGEQSEPETPQKGGTGFKLEVVDDIPSGGVSQDNNNANGKTGTGFRLESVDDIPQ